MRLFIAIPLPDKIKNDILMLQNALDKKIFRMTRSEQLHLTIAFLGEEIGSESIIKKLEKVKFDKFYLKTKCYGFFPSQNKIRVVWRGLDANPEFMKLQHDIRVLFKFKEKLMPHITIARARTIIIDKENYWNKTLSKIKFEEQEFLVDKFILFESVPGQERHTHNELKIFNAKDY